MDLGSLLLVLALAIIVVLYVSRPFFETKNVPASMLFTEVEHELSALLAERDRILGALHELDFDYALGKIPEEEYPAQRASLVANGANVLRQIDALEAPANGSEEVQDQDFEARLEHAIATRRVELRGDPVTPVTTLEKTSSTSKEQTLADPDDDLEVIIADRRRNRNDKAAGFCPKCGDPLQKSDRFCPKCGTSLVL